MEKPQPDGAGAAAATSGAADCQVPQPGPGPPRASDVAAVTIEAQSSPEGTLLSHDVQPDGATQVPGAALGRSEPASRKRKLPASLATASQAAPPLTIRSLAAPRKPAVPSAQAISRGGASADAPQQSLAGSGAAPRGGAAGRQPASAQPGASPEAAPPARAPPAAPLPAAKPRGPRRLPASLLQPPSTGVAATHVSPLPRAATTVPCRDEVLRGSRFRH